MKIQEMQLSSEELILCAAIIDSHIQKGWTDTQIGAWFQEVLLTKHTLMSDIRNDHLANDLYEAQIKIGLPAVLGKMLRASRRADKVIHFEEAIARMERKG